MGTVPEPKLLAFKLVKLAPLPLNVVAVAVPVIVVDFVILTALVEKEIISVAPALIFLLPDPSTHNLKELFPAS